MKGNEVLVKEFIFSCLVILLLGIISISVLPAQAKANWWDKFGKPQYGGKAAVALGRLGDTFDPGKFYTSIYFHYEQMFMFDLTMDRDVWACFK